MTKVKTKSKGAKASPAKKGSASAAKNGASTRRTAEDVDALVPQFLSKIEDGATMRQLKQDFGFSDDGPIRAALYRAGYDRKGEKHGVKAGDLAGTKGAARAKKMVELRKEGEAWYVLAHRFGVTEAEAKSLVSEAGGPTGRVYKASEKPAPKKASGKKGAKAGR
jgi:hypothetical protein